MDFLFFGKGDFLNRQKPDCQKSTSVQIEIMSSSIFSNYSTQKITAQPTTTSKIVFRSSSASDAVAISFYGVQGTVVTDSKNLIAGRENVTTATFDSIYQIKLASVAVGNVTGYSQGISAVGDIRCDTNPADNDTIVIGLKTYRFKNTLAAVNDVKIGGSTTATMLSLSRAINLNGTAGTDYFAGTLINEIYSSAVATNVITVTDKIPCLRTASYPVTSSSSSFSIRTPIGGEDGALLFTIPVGQTICQSSFTLNSPTLATMTLPKSVIFQSGSINTNGEHPMVVVATDVSIDIFMELSQDGVNWRTTQEGSFTLSVGYNYFNLLERCENIRINLNNNSVSDRYVDARVIY